MNQFRLAACLMLLSSVVLNAQTPATKSQSEKSPSAASTKEDFYQALDAARNFSGDAPRALAMISVGRAMFEKKGSSKSDARSVVVP